MKTKLQMNAYRLIILLLGYACSMSVWAEIDPGMHFIRQGSIATLYSYTGTSSKVVLPDSVSLIGSVFEVRKIHSGAFCDNAEIEELVINTPIYIDSEAFTNCPNLKKITFAYKPDIHGHAFKECRALKEYCTLENDNDFQSIDGLLCVGRNKLYLCPPGLEGEITLPSSIVATESEPFKGCEYITAVTFPKEFNELMTHTMWGNHSIRKIEIMGACHVWELSCESHPLLEEVILNDECYIGSHAFANCTSLKKINITYGYLLENGVFANCTSLEHIYIPAECKTIKWGAFAFCSSLSTICIAAPNPPRIVLFEGITGYPFDGCPTDAKVLVPCGSLQAYRNHPDWQYFSNYGLLDGFEIIFSEQEKIAPADTRLLEPEIILAEDVSIDSTSWTSSDEEIATVDNTGIVTAINEGLCTITLTATDNSGMTRSGSVELTVSKDASIISPSIAAPAPQYYNLQGQPVDNPTSGIYLRRTGSTITKIAL